MKTVLKLFKDIFLFCLILLLLAVGVWGFRLPYRNTFTAVGTYQLEAFETGLAFFHYGRGQTPFYNISPLNDFVVVEGTRSALLSNEAYATKAYHFQIAEEKPQAILTTLKSFFGYALPWYRVTTPAYQVSYSTSQTGDRVTITREISLIQPKYINEQGITVWYNGADVVFDLATRHIYTPADEQLIDLINREYNLALTDPSPEALTPVETNGRVGIINPTRPGWLEVSVGLNHTLYINRQYHLIEVTSPVNHTAESLQMSMVITGHVGRE